MHRLLWAGLVYALASAVIVVGAPGLIHADPHGRPRPFGLYPGQSPVALSATLPAVGVASYVAIALIDLAG